MIETVPATGSTNADLLARLDAGERIAESHWLLADRQTAGRGRQGRAWSDGAGNFMGSTVVHRASGDPPAPSLSLLAGVALLAAVVAFHPDPPRPVLKWPNDLLLGGDKLAGVLLESRGDSIVVGIGVNLAQAPDLPGRGTVSLADHGTTSARDAFAAALAETFADRLVRWRTYGLEPILREWRAGSLPEGTPLSVHDAGGEHVAGTFAGLTDEGALRLRSVDGTIRVVHAGDVTLAPKDPRCS